MFLSAMEVTADIVPAASTVIEPDFSSAATQAQPNKTLEHNTAPALGFGGRLWWHYGFSAHYVVVGAVWLSFSFGDFIARRVSCPPR